MNFNKGNPQDIIKSNIDQLLKEEKESKIEALRRSEDDSALEDEDNQDLAYCSSDDEKYVSRK